MSVYVDDLFATAQTARWRYPHACHMTADSIEELHEFASRIGLRRSWFQGGRRPHYDLTSARRAVAVRAGALEIGRRDMVSRTLALGAARGEAGKGE